jgi:hypothetical protein
VDIGKRNCKACIMNSDGSIAEESVYNNTLAEAEIFAYSMCVLIVPIYIGPVRALRLYCIKVDGF